MQQIVSFDSLINYEKELKGFLRRRVGCDALVEDLYQGLAEKLLKRSCGELENPKAYLFQSAANAVTDHFRASAVRESYVSQAQSEEALHIDTKSPERVIAAAELISAIELSLAELPLLTQKVFYLYRLDGLTQQAIAEQLGISRSTVERRLNKAINHWQKKLDQETRKLS